MYISQKYGEVGHVVDRLALEALFEQVAVATVLSIIIVHVGACYALDGLSSRLPAKFALGGALRFTYISSCMLMFIDMRRDSAVFKQARYCSHCSSCFVHGEHLLL